VTSRDTLALVEAPPIRYAQTQGGSIAWQECGAADAPPLILLPPLAQNIEAMWEKPVFWRPLLRLASRVRCIQYDKLGTGLSDPCDDAQTLDERVDDVVAVLDAAGVESATMFGMSEGGTTAVRTSVRHPDRVNALVLLNTFAGTSDLAEVAKHGPLPPPHEVIEFWQQFCEKWGTPDTLTLTHFAPSVGADEALRQWTPRYERAAASPSLIERWVQSAFTLDVAADLARVRTPTLVVHLDGDRVVPVAHGRYLAANIPGARYREFSGDDHFLWMSPDVDDYIDAVHGFLAELGLATATVDGAGRIRDRWDPLAVLTPGERRCVRLAQRGLTNAAIAESLGLSIRTVENNLSRAFPKLGVRSRVELAVLGEGRSR